MKKKALAIALSLCMTAGLMAGCGSKPAENTAAEPSEQASEPVSYTHLDVYKRQGRRYDS